MTPSFRRLLGPGLATLLMLLVLVGLGTWQVERMFWKQDILRRVAAAESGEAIPLPARPEPFAKVSVSGRFRTDLSALYGAEVRTEGNRPVMGARLIMPLERDAGPPVLVDRGWVPLERKAPILQPGDDVTVVGYVHPGNRQTWFSAADSPSERRFFTLDPVTIAAALGLTGAGAFVVVQLGPGQSSGLPEPARHMPRPPNNHLAYAITWYGLAIALVLVFIVWVRKGASA